METTWWLVDDTHGGLHKVEATNTASAIAAARKAAGAHVPAEWTAKQAAARS